MPVAAATQIAVLAAVVPFSLAVLRPQELLQHPLVREWRVSLGITDQLRFIQLSALILILALLISNLASVLARWMVIRFTTDEHHELNNRIFRGVLKKPYEWFIAQSPSELLNGLVYETFVVALDGYRFVLDCLSNFGVLVAILGTLLWVHPGTAISAFLFLTVAYLGFYMVISRRLRSYGESMAETRRQETHIIRESLEGFKDIRAGNTANTFLSEYEKVSKLFNLSKCRHDTLVDSGRFVMELVAIIGMIVFFLMAMNSQGLSSEILVLLALYVVAAIRMLPLLQRAFYCLTQLKRTLPHVDVLSSLLVDLELDVADSDPTPFPDLKEEIRLESLSYRYPGSDDMAVKSVDTSISKGSLVAVVGRSGEGKTTLLDLLLGLLPVGEGRILIDGRPLEPERAASWRNTVGLVSQNVYLLDDTIENNVIFGRMRTADSSARVLRALAISQLEDFVAQLADGASTRIGNNGVRLSGGQRQRLAIARALYEDPQVLIFDEATNALDVNTEKALFSALRGERTIIFVGHRLDAAKDCDKILLLQGGCLVAEGSYEELFESQALFRNLVSG